MTFDEVVIALKEVEQSKSKLHSLERSIKFYQSRLTNCTQDIHGVGEQTSKGNSHEAKLVSYFELLARYDELLLITLDKETRAYKAIERLTIEEQNVIIDKYIHGNPWKVVSKNRNYSERQLRRIRDRAVNKLKNML